MDLVKYQNLNNIKISELVLKVPVKNMDHYVSGIYNKTETEMYFQFDDVVVSPADKFIIKLSESQLHFFNSIDNLVIQRCNNHSLEWFNKKLDIEDINKNYISTIKPLKDTLYLGNVDTVPVFNGTNWVGEGLSVLQDNTTISIILKCNIKFLSSKIFCEWVPIQIKYSSKNQPKYLFNDN